MLLAMLDSRCICVSPGCVHKGTGRTGAQDVGNCYFKCSQIEKAGGED